MLNLFKMDLRRMFRGKLFYILVVGLGVLLGTFAMTGTIGSASIASLIGSVASGGSDMMASMGISMTMIFGAIFVTALIGSDFTSGFIKNILTVHSKKTDYIVAKLLISVIGSVIMIGFYFVLMFILGAIKGLPFGEVSGGGIVLFLIEKVLLSVALNALVILLNVFLRNRVIGILGCFVLGMGAVSMLLALAGSALNVSLLTVLSTFSVGGCSGIGTLIPSAGVFFQTLIVAAIWTALALFCSDLVLKKKDLKQ